MDIQIKEHIKYLGMTLSFILNTMRNNIINKTRKKILIMRHKTKPAN